MNGNTIDLTGRTFGKMTVLKYDHSNKNGAYWLCECECKNTKIVSAHSLKTGHTASCGCLYFSVNNQSKERLYRIWKDMLRRCYSPKCKSYRIYGGRGIVVCEEWKIEYSIFKEWAMSSGYSNKLTIDRIDSNGNYEPSNCKWSTYKEQENNSSNNRVIEYGGASHSVAIWAEILGLSYPTLISRIRRGWSVDRAFYTPQQKRARNG
jgi:hypothetical protein